MTNDILTAIRAGFAAVAESADHVTIRHDRLAAYAASLPAAPPDNVFDDTHHYTAADDEGTASYVMALDAINFGSGYKPLMAAEGWSLVNGSIYFTVARRLKDEFIAAAPFTPAHMAALMDDDCRRILALPRGRHSDAFAALCASSLRELGAAVAGQGGGFAAFVAAHDHAAALVERLAALPHFHDVHDYKGRDIPILKRAQITAADLHLAYGRRGRVLFNDIARLTMFADNAVPHVLRVDGILDYSPALAARIAAGEYLPAGSAAEVEIRACAGHVVELLAAQKGLRAMDIDHILWHRSAENQHYRNKPTHRTLTPFY